MINLNLTAVLLVCSALSGSLVLALGLAVGMWLWRRRTPATTVDLQNSEQVAALLRGLSQWTGNFSSEIAAYRNVLGDLEQRVRSETDQGEGPTPANGVFTEITRANDLLQKRLNTAEATLRQQAEEIASYLTEARTDSLTALPNRRAFDAECARRFAEWRRYGTPFSVVLVDVDHFKAFNDRHGHLAGDQVLCEVARVLRSVLRETDFPARFGGEEFALLFPSQNVGDAGAAAERIRLAIESMRCAYEGQQLEVTVSCGAAQALQHEELAQLFKRADQALYASKKGGRNCTHWHDGKRCVLVPRGNEAPSAVASPFVSADLQAACTGLRNRLLEITTREAGPR